MLRQSCNTSPKECHTKPLRYRPSVAVALTTFSIFQVAHNFNRRVYTIQYLWQKCLQTRNVYDHRRRPKGCITILQPSDRGFSKAAEALSNNILQAVVQRQHPWHLSDNRTEASRLNLLYNWRVPALFYRLLQISHLYAKPPCCSSKFYMSIPLSLSLTEYTLSKISNWSPYIFTLVFNVRFDYTKFMLLLINQGFARTLQVISFKKYFLQRRC